MSTLHHNPPFVFTIHPWPSLSTLKPKETTSSFLSLFSFCVFIIIGNIGGIFCWVLCTSFSFPTFHSCTGTGLCLTLLCCDPPSTWSHWPSTQTSSILMTDIKRNPLNHHLRPFFPLLPHHYLYPLLHSRSDTPVVLAGLLYCQV